MQESWVIIGIILAIFLFVIGTFSTVQKNAKTPLRKKGLNDLQETLPRTLKGNDKKESFEKKVKR